jgi:DNA-binding NarL/FixJ family response regulator
VLVSGDNIEHSLNGTGAIPITLRQPGGASVSVVIADDNPVLRLGLHAMFEREPRIAVVGEAHDGPSAVALAAERRPDVLLLQIRAPSELAAVALVGPPTRVAVLTGLPDPGTVVRAVAAGARSYLLHGCFQRQELIDAVLGTAAGRSHLSPPAAAALVDHLQGGAVLDPGGTGELTRRELEVLELMAEGLSNAQIAERLTISGKTVKNHVHHVYKRLNAENREQAVAIWTITGGDLARS